MTTRSLLLALCTVLILDSTLRADDAPTAAERQRDQNNLKRLALAFHNYESVYGAFPRNITDKDGKVLLSWRVAILPYLEEEKLYKQFKLDEAWDSEHNKKLSEEMPKVFAPIKGKAEKNETFYAMFEGEGAMLNPKHKTTIVSVTDGTSNSLLIVHSAKPIRWSKPEDISFDAKKELPALGGMFGGDFNAAMADGSVRYIKKSIAPETLKAFITINGGEVIR